MISGRDIIYISSIEWNFLWQGHQEIALRLAAAGNRILYIENTGVRSPGLRDAGRVLLRLKRWAKALQSNGVRNVAPNIYVCSPMTLPPFGSKWKRELNRRIFLPLVRQAARKLGMRNVLLWTYLPTDTTVDLVRSMRKPGSTVIYYCVADFSQLSPHAERLRCVEKQLIEDCDHVFVNCSELAARFSQWHQSVHVFPVGVNLDAFPLDNSIAREDRDESDESGAVVLDGIPGPLIGYVGGIHRHVDLQMLIEMAKARPAWSWIFVGTVQTPVGELAELPNVHLLGPWQHSELVHFIRRFNVCIVPYINSEYTRTVVPTKINEYLAVGKPVVSTDLPTVSEFNREHQILTLAPARSEPFLEAIERALNSLQPVELVSRRRRVAGLSDWQGRLEAMSQLIDGHPESRVSEPLDPQIEAATAREERGVEPIA